MDGNRARRRRFQLRDERYGTVRLGSKGFGQDVLPMPFAAGRPHPLEAVHGLPLFVGQQEGGSANDATAVSVGGGAYYGSFNRPRVIPVQLSLKN